MSASLCVSQSSDSRGGVLELSHLRRSTEVNQAGQQRTVYWQATVLVGWIAVGEGSVGDGKKTSRNRRCQMVVTCVMNTGRSREGLSQQVKYVWCDVCVCV